MAQYDALLTACFGTADPQRFDRCFAALHRLALQQGDFQTGMLAVTSGKIHLALARQGVRCPSPEEALEQLFRCGARRVLVLSVFLTDGLEWDRLRGICAAQAGQFERLDLTPPLLCGDIPSCAAVIGQLFPRRADGATVLLGHGCAQGRNAPYLELAGQLHTLGREDIYLALMHGEPGITAVGESLRADGITGVRFGFLMLCTGHHAREAFASGGAVSVLGHAGIRTDVCDLELGQIPAFQQLFVRPEVLRHRIKL